MTTSSIVLIVVVAVALHFCSSPPSRGWRCNKRNQHRHVVADKIRGQAAKDETLQVKQREALADETAAKARAAQAEADVKAAQASGLQQQAAAHRSEAATSRDQLNEQLDRADTMDPATPTDETPRSTHKEPQTL